MRYHHIQMRFPASEMRQGMKFQYENMEYTLGFPVPTSLETDDLPIGVLMSGYTEQFYITAGGAPAGEAWFYVYGAFEGGQWAVLDELLLFAKEPYGYMKRRHQAEFNAFPTFFVFSEKGFGEGMKLLGLDPSDTDKVTPLSSTGGYIRKSDTAALKAMFDRHTEELEAAIQADPTGDGFIYEMFCNELSNHEYSYTHEVDDALEALGFTMEQVEADIRLLHGLEKAMSYCCQEAI